MRWDETIRQCYRNFMTGPLSTDNVVWIKQVTPLIYRDINDILDDLFKLQKVNLDNLNSIFRRAKNWWQIDIPLFLPYDKELFVEAFQPIQELLLAQQAKYVSAGYNFTPEFTVPPLGYLNLIATNKTKTDPVNPSSLSNPQMLMPNNSETREEKNSLVGDKAQTSKVATHSQSSAVSMPAKSVTTASQPAVMNASAASGGGMFAPSSSGYYIAQNPDYAHGCPNPDDLGDFEGLFLRDLMGAVYR